MAKPNVSCCDPIIRRNSWVHSDFCPLTPKVTIVSVSSTQRARAEQARQARMAAEDAHAGVPTATVYELRGRSWARSLPDSCDWHEGVEYTTGGICAGPRCRDYTLAHVDDND